MDFDALAMVFSMFNKLGSQVMKPALEQRQHARKSSRASRNTRSPTASYLRPSAFRGCWHTKAAGPPRAPRSTGTLGHGFFHPLPVDPRCTGLPDLMEAIMLMPTEIIRGRRTAVTVEQLNRDSPREVMVVVGGGGLGGLGGGGFGFPIQFPPIY